MHFFSAENSVAARHAHSRDHARRTAGPIDTARSATSTTSATACSIVATDRISAFDYVLGSGIPDKGKVLTQISVFWFGRTTGIVDNHLLSIDPAAFPGEARGQALLAGRSMLVKKTEPLPIECVARGYLSGSGWKDYVATGEVCGIRAAERAARIGSPARSRSSRRPPRRRAGTTSTSAKRGPWRWSAGRSSIASAT